MALKGNLKKENEKDIFVAEFTNGTVQQLKDLAEFLEKEGFSITKEPEEKRLADVVKVGIGFLERVRENLEKSKENPTE